MEFTTTKLLGVFLAVALMCGFFVDRYFTTGEQKVCIQEVPTNRSSTGVKKQCPPCTTQEVNETCPVCPNCSECSLLNCPSIEDCNCYTKCPNHKWVPMNLERFPMLSGPFEQKTNLRKNILFVALGEGGKEHIRNIIRRFPSSHFVYIFAVYDASDWRNETFFKQVNWIFTVGQMRFWPMKRFLHPDLIPAYDSVWVMDEDVDFQFDPVEYVEQMKLHHVDLSMPGNNPCGTYWRAGCQSDQPLLLRWTNFVECGPLWVASAKAWPYIWDLLNPEAVTGWGLDKIWCQWLRMNMPGFSGCAVFDAFPMRHMNQKSASSKSNYSPSNELALYDGLEGGKYSRSDSDLHQNLGSILIGNFKPKKIEQPPAWV